MISTVWLRDVFKLAKLQSIRTDEGQSVFNKDPKMNKTTNNHMVYRISVHDRISIIEHIFGLTVDVLAAELIIQDDGSSSQSAQRIPKDPLRIEMCSRFSKLYISPVEDSSVGVSAIRRVPCERGRTVLFNAVPDRASLFKPATSSHQTLKFSTSGSNREV